jgi:WD40 repeat protein
LTPPEKPRGRGKILTWQGRGKWRWFAIGVVITGALVAARFEFRHAGLAGLANAAAVVSVIPPLVVGLVAWAKREKPGAQPDDYTVTLSDLMRTIADAQGMTSRDLKDLLADWPEDLFDSYMNGEELPPWSFISAFLDEVSLGDSQRRELMERRLRKVWWKSGGESLRDGDPGRGPDAVQMADPETIAWQQELLEAVKTLQAAQERHESVVALAGLLPFISEDRDHLAQKIAELEAERESLRAQIADLQAGRAASHEAQAENERLRSRLQDLEEQLQDHARDRASLAVRLAEAERKLRRAQDLRNVAVTRAQRARRVAGLDRSTAASLPPTDAEMEDSGLISLTAGADRRTVPEILGKVDDVLGEQAEKLGQFSDQDQQAREAAPVDDHGRSSGGIRGNVRVLVGAVVVILIAVGFALAPFAGTDGNNKPNSATKGRNIHLKATHPAASPPATTPPATPKDSLLLPGLPTRALSGAFSSDGKLLAVGAVNGDIREWDVSTHTLVDSMNDPGSKGVNAVAFSVGNTLLAAADADGYVSLWAGHNLVQTLADPSGESVLSVAFSFDGEFLAIGDKAGHVYTCKFSGGRCGEFGSPMTDPSSNGVDSVAFNPGDSVLAAGDANGNIYMWIHTLGKIIPDPSREPVRSVTFTADNNFLVSGDAAGQVYQWGYTSSGNKVTATSNPITSSSDPHSKGVESVTDNALTGVITAVDANGHVYLWHGAATVQSPLVVPAGNGVLAVTSNGADDLFAIGDADGQVYLWPMS